MTSTPPPAPDRSPDPDPGPDPTRWAAAVREVVRLRREEAAADSADEDAMAADLQHILRADRPTVAHREPSTP